MFVLWRMTKDPKYREWGWQIFEAFEKHTKVAHAGCGLRVARTHTRMRARTRAGRCACAPASTSRQALGQAWLKRGHEPRLGGHRYAGLKDVTLSQPVQDDTMQTFWLAETLKYFYLLFSDDDVISFDDYVLNTEAHPLRIFDFSEIGG